MASTLIWASENGHGKVVEKLLGNGASLDLQTEAVYTALMAATGFGHAEVVEKLLGDARR